MDRRKGTIRRIVLGAKGPYKSEKADRSDAEDNEGRVGAVGRGRKEGRNGERARKEEEKDKRDYDSAVIYDPRDPGEPPTHPCACALAADACRRALDEICK